tara:strand:+ start:239 stop:493 length:255 start_codon:yes stop_codon:yes gene_type:complete
MKEKHSKIEAYLIEQAVLDENREQENFWTSPVYSSHKAAILAVEFGNPLHPDCCGSCFMLGKSKGQLYHPDGKGGLHKQIVEFG